jgi:DNA-binding transcriptional MerR regulator
MKIGEVAKRSGLSVDTIRYYERIGLLPPADRNRAGQRDYDESILVWIDFLNRLKSTGMSIREMLRYGVLRDQGPETEQARHDLLVAHREFVRATIADLQTNLLVLDHKIAGYAATLNRTKTNDAPDPSPDTRELPQQTRRRHQIRARLPRTGRN